MRLLIVEDEVGLAEALAAILRKEKYAVDVSYDGLSGLENALSGLYDCILLDIMLPKMNGVEVLKNIRNEKIETPVLLLTAKSEVNDKIQGLDAGADDYLTKPFVKGELLARIRALTRRKGTVIESSPRFGDITLNLRKCELSCGTESVLLGRKEFQMMEMLISAGGQIVTKELFVQKIWGYDDDTEYNNVEVYISFLRKKLQLLNSTVQIRTRRGVGYCLDGVGS
ncbi:MAG: response regulator transcription factor [Acutalibacteraceae bacterium]